MPRIELAGASCHYRGDEGRWVPGVEEVWLDVADRELLVLLGPSGAGKTTVLRLIAGLEFPITGEVRFEGQRVNHLQAADRDVGFVFQTAALFPHLTVRENLGLGLTLRRRAPAAVDEAVRHMAGRLGLTGLLARRPGQLSGGERQRVALGRALIRRPAILLLDEPLANLDGPLRRQLRDDIRDLHREWGTTTVCVTHDLREADWFGGRVAVMNQGRILQVGTIEGLRERAVTPWVRDFLQPI